MSTYAPNQNAELKNTNRWGTKQLVTMALMCAIAILLSFIEFPIFPAASFLKLDISFVPSAVMGVIRATPAPVKMVCFIGRSPFGQG